MAEDRSCDGAGARALQRRGRVGGSASFQGHATEQQSALWLCAHAARRAAPAGPSPHSSSTRVVLLSGAASGLLARFFTHPLDSVKARLMVQSAVADGRAGGLARALPLPYAGTADALAKMARAEGVAGFYRGFSAVAAAAPLASAVYFGGYELSKRLLLAGDAAGAEAALPPAAAYVASGVVAQACAGLVYTPLDVVKERMQVQQLLLRRARGGGPPVQAFASSAACFASILRSEGARGAMRGYWASNAAWWPWNIIYFVSYEHLRDAAAAEAFGGDKAALPPLASASAATAAATLATVVTNPIDVVKTRLQALPGAAGAAGGALGVAREMYAAEGLAVFGAGMAARVLSIAPGSFIAFFAFESIRAAFAAREEARERSGDAAHLALA